MTVCKICDIVFLAVKKAAGMAQLVEQRIRNAQVVGSSPTTSSKMHSVERYCAFRFT